MKKLVIAASIFTLATVFSFANTTHEALQNQVSRAAALAAANPPQRPQMSDAAILKIMENKHKGCDYKFADGHSRLKSDKWRCDTWKFQRTSDGFIITRGPERLECKLRLDGFYGLYRSDGWTEYPTTVVDKNGNPVNNQQLLNNYNNRNLKKLNTLKLFDQMNKDMLASILAAYGIYSLDFVSEDKVHTLYGDALDKNVEIKFIKQDNKIVYGTLFVSNDSPDNEGSEIYAFKFSDQTTPNKQRAKLMIKRVVQNNLDEDFPNTNKNQTVTKGKESKSSRTTAYPLLYPGIRIRSINQVASQYEQFLAEGVIHITFTKNGGILYKNQQKVF